MGKLGFTEAMLFTYSGNVKKNWFVGFRMTDPKSGIRKPFQLKGGINYKKTRADRMDFGRAFEKLVNKALKSGWNPFEEDVDTFNEKLETKSELPKEKSFNDKNFSEALDFCIQNGSWASKTARSFANTCGYYKEAAKKLNILDVDVKLITKQHIVQMSNQAKTDLNWSNNSFNKYIGYLGSAMKVLVDWQIIENNPCHKIALKPVAETNMYESYTDDEKKAIQAHLINNHYNYYIYLMVIYHTGIRPKEVLGLKIKDVNLSEQEITIKPDMELENSKTKKIRNVAVNNHLLELLKEMRLNEYPKEYYIFGSPFDEGKGNRGRNEDGSYGSSHPDFLRPSLVHIKRDTVTKLWNRIIIKKLGINKYQYAAKHSGADAKLLAGVDMDALKEMYGHSSKQMTEKYTSVLKQVNKKKIIDLSPDF